MNYGKIIHNDVANGEGIRVTLFVSGCTNHCKGCFQPQTWDFNYGKKFDAAAEKEILEALSMPYIDGLTILGGEPFEPDNQEEVLRIIIAAKELRNDINIWIYTGFTFEQLLDDTSYCNIGNITRKILNNVDIIADGRFVEELKNLSLAFRGSSNQRIIDVKKSLSSGKIVKYIE